MKRIVLDTSVWVSGFIIPGSKASSLAITLIRGEHTGIISLYILVEIERTLSTPRLMEKYRLRRQEILSFLLALQTRLESVEPLAVTRSIRDPGDLPILGTALAGRATHLVTGDRDLLEDHGLREWMHSQGVAIIRLAEF